MIYMHIFIFNEKNNAKYNSIKLNLQGILLIIEKIKNYLFLNKFINP